MRGDGNGWAAGPNGVSVWGRFGAAGLFLVARAEPGGWCVLLQHRAPWTNHGGTWALPGGARDSHESAVEAALRETEEETALAAGAVGVLGEIVTAGPYPGDPERPELPGGWTYTTVIGRTASGLRDATDPNDESLELRWVPFEDVDELPLLPAFRSSFPRLRELALERLRDAGAGN